MSIVDFGNELNRTIEGAKNSLFGQGEIAQLTYGAFDVVTTNVDNSTADEITIEFPIGYRADKTTILGTRKYQKDQLRARYAFLALTLLPTNGLLQLITLVEALLFDLIRMVINQHPKKLGEKQQVSLKLVLESKSIDEIRTRAIDELINSVSYKTPREFAEVFASFTGVKLLECPSFHIYIEAKATRDILIHNRGVANDTYLRKAGSHARGHPGQALPVHVQYFLESYEACLKLTEWLEAEFHEQWHSSEYKLRSLEKPSAATSNNAAVTDVLVTDPSKGLIEEANVNNAKSTSIKKTKAKSKAVNV
jgi:hypothetical protein